MKIAVIADVHDNIANLEKFLKWCASAAVKDIVCCGDLTGKDTLEFLSENFSGQIYLVKGNIDYYSDEDAAEFKNIKYFGRTGCFTANGKKVCFCHEPFLIKQIKKPDCFIVFYGHTHKPWSYTEIAEGKKIICVNPGPLGGMFGKATFALWDSQTEKLELKILEFIKIKEEA